MSSSRTARRAAVLVTLACLALPGVAAGQDLALAESLFDTGLREMQAGNYEKACPALAESHRIDPRPGTLFTLAECENKAGRIATAVARYEDYLRLFAKMSPDQQAKQQGREKISAEQKAALSPQVPKLTVKLPEKAPAGTVVTLDGVRLGGPAIGLALAVDPGERVLTTQAPSGPLRETRITIERGESKEVVLEVEAAPAEAKGAEAKEPTPGAAAGVGVAPPGAGDVAEDGSSRRTLAFVAGGVGVAGIAVGAIFGGVTLGKKSTISDHCTDGRCRTQEGLDAAESAKTTGLVSTIGFGVGAVGLATGIVLFATAPTAKHARGAAPAPSFAASAAPMPGGAFASFRGNF